jgi:hypothetical protein
MRCFCFVLQYAFLTYLFGQKTSFGIPKLQWKSCHYINKTIQVRATKFKHDIKNGLLTSEKKILSLNLILRIWIINDRLLVGNLWNVAFCSVLENFHSKTDFWSFRSRCRVGTHYPLTHWVLLGGYPLKKTH